MRFQDEAAIEARTANISRGGLFICMDPPKPIGTRVRVRIQLANTHETFVLEGIVVRSVPDPDEPAGAASGPPGVGVFLTQASAGWAPFVDTLGTRLARGTLDDPGKTQSLDPVVEERVRNIKDVERR